MRSSLRWQRAPRGYKKIMDFGDGVRDIELEGELEHGLDSVVVAGESAVVYATSPVPFNAPCEHRRDVVEEVDCHVLTVFVVVGP